MKMRVFEAKDIEYNRRLLEQNKGIILEGLEYSNREDSPKYLNSGLNSIIARIAAKKGNAIGINTLKLSGLPKRQKAATMARIRQNIILCGKSGAHIAVSQADENEKRAIIESLGGSTVQSSQAISF